MSEERAAGQAEVVKIDELVGKKAVLTVDGVPEEVDIGEVLKNRQKWAGSEKRFQEAAEKEKAAESNNRIVNLLKTGIENRDVASLKKGLMGIGMTEEQADAALGVSSGGEPDDDFDFGQDSGSGGGNGQGSDGASHLEQQIAALSAQVEKLQSDLVEKEKTQRQANVVGQVDRAVDSDSELATMLKEAEKAEPGSGEFWKRAIYATVAQVHERSPSWGPDVIQKGIELFKKRHKALLGSQGTSTGQAAGGTPGSPGFGPAGSPNRTAQLLHDAAAAGEPKKVPMTDPKFGDYFKGLVMKSLRKASGEGSQG